jgi:hypothetical protein
MGPSVDLHNQGAVVPIPSSGDQPRIQKVSLGMLDAVSFRVPTKWLQPLPSVGSESFGGASF